MKKLLNLLLTLAVVTSAMAGTVNRQQAREAAAQFALKKGAQLGTEPTTVRGRRVQTADQPLYIFNTTGGQGFIVVSGDDRTDAILGYTTQGSYDDTTVPPALQEWLDQMTGEIEALDLQPAEARTAANAPKAEPQQVAIHKAIEPLIATTWNQGNTYKHENNNTDGIYNFKLPQDGSYYPCTGCVATAGAQIMYYFKCPKGMTKEVPGYENGNPNVNTSRGLPSTQFKWDKMKTSYDNSDAYTEAAEAVAELMLYAGYAAHMRYSVDGSSANQMTLARGMAEYFGYDPYSLNYIKRSDYSVVEWDELMYNELVNGRPIIYDGNTTQGSGHAFLCDGYDDEGLYHFNWGWGGSYNGYFKLQATNPYRGNDSPGYIVGNSAVIGIQPNTGIVPEDPNANDEWETPVIEGLVASVDFNGIDGTNVSLAMWNKNEEECGFGFGIGELLDDGTIKVVDNKYEYTINTQLPQYRGWGERLFDFSTYAETLTNGTHKLIPISRLNGETEWKRCRPANLWFEVNIDDGNVTIIKHPFFDLQINRFEMVSPGVPGNWQKVLVSVTNNGDNIEKNYYIFVDDVWPGWSSSVRTLKIAAGNTKEFVLETGELPEGSYTLTLRDGYNGPVVATQDVVIKQEVVATAFTLVEEMNFAGTTLPVDVTVENRAGDFTMPLYLFASQSESIGNCVYAAGTGIPRGGTEDVRFYFKPDAGGTWNLWVATDAAGTDVIGKGSVDIVEAPSGTVELTLLRNFHSNLADGKITYSLDVSNTGEATNYRALSVNLFYNTGDGWDWKTTVSSEEKVIEPGCNETITVTLEGLEEGIEYLIQTHYRTAYNGGSTWINDYYTFTYTAPPVEPDPDPVPGDINGNNGLDTEDVTILVDYLTGKLPEEPANADANGDEKVDILDIVFIISQIIPQQSE